MGWQVLRFRLCGQKTLRGRKNSVFDFEFFGFKRIAKSLQHPIPKGQDWFAWKAILIGDGIQASVSVMDFLEVFIKKEEFFIRFPNVKDSGNRDFWHLFRYDLRGLELRSTIYEIRGL